MRKLTNEEFINLAYKIHSRYGYDKVVYVNSHSKVKITCPDHGDFLQTPNVHLSGSGCPSCKWEKVWNKTRYTTSEFIEKAKCVHGTQYDYGQSEYKNSKTKIRIFCKVHGSFYQLPCNHLFGAGCHKCGYEKCNSIKFSKIEKEFLDYIGIKNRRECVGHYVVDGINSNEIYEFLGDYWHGNPQKYDRKERNLLCKKTFGELYDYTFLRFQKLKELGYKVKYIWENDWERYKTGKDKTLQLKEF